MVHELNDPHRFKSQQNSHTFEDNIVCNYQDTLTRARMCEIALILGKYGPKMVFCTDKKDKETQNATMSLQEEAIHAVRRTLNITCLYDGVDRRRDSRGYDVGRLITYGQAHCHGLTSCMAAVLLPLQRCIGIEMKYRTGFTFSSGEPINENIDRHHWLELTTLPSYQSFSCDLTRFRRADRFANYSELFLPITVCYGTDGGCYPFANKGANMPSFVVKDRA